MESVRPLRERLIDVGADLVLAEGAASVGLREIARRAGVSHGAPRRYFPTHHALLSAIAHRGFADLAARFAAAAGSASGPRERLAALCQAYLRYALECRGMFELMFRHDLLDSTDEPAGGPRLRETTVPLFALIADLVAACRPPTSTPPQVTAAALWANIHGIAQLWTWESLQLVLAAAPPADPLDQLVAAALDAHLGPVSAPGPACA